MVARTETADLIQIKTLILAESGVESRSPWIPPNEAAIDAELHTAVSHLCERLELEAKPEFNHYGSGYASFVDAWFFRRDESFRKSARDNHYTGLAVLLSRIGPCFCLMEGEKTSNAVGATSYLPSFDAVDVFATPAVEQLSHQVAHALADLKYIRLRREAVEAALLPNTEIPTILTDGPYRRFDALFHWED